MHEGFCRWGSGIARLARQIWHGSNELTRRRPWSSTTKGTTSFLDARSGSREYFPAELASIDVLSAFNSLALDPVARMAPKRELKRLRTVGDAARLRDSALGTGVGTADEVHAATVRFLDDAVTGLLRFARAAVDWDADSGDEPIACVAIGGHASGQEKDQLPAALLLLLEGRGYRRARSEAVAGFIAHGLRDLGIEVPTRAMTVSAATAMLAGPIFADRARRRRLIAGKCALFAEFESRMSAAKKRVTHV
jgi:hypothetical protein